MKDLSNSFAPTVLRLAVGGISLFNAAHILRIIGPTTDPVTGPAEAVKFHSDRLAAAGIPAAVPVTWVLLGLMILSGLCILLGFYTRKAAVGLALVCIAGVISGPNIWLLGQIERSERLGTEVCLFALAICIALMMTGGGSLSIKNEQ